MTATQPTSSTASAVARTAWIVVVLLTKGEAEFLLDLGEHVGRADSSLEWKKVD
jgi:hypothetical protein